MTIDQRQYAPDQSEVIDPTKLSEVVEQLQTVSNEIAGERIDIILWMKIQHNLL